MENETVLPSIKTHYDIADIEFSSDTDCGLITFLGLRRDKEVR